MPDTLSGQKNVESGGRYFADIRLLVRVFFDDDGGENLTDQAIDALDMHLFHLFEDGVFEENGAEIIGKVQEISQ